jgi:hypothetical protein
MALYNGLRYNESQYQFVLIPESVTLSDAKGIDSTKPLSDTAFLNDNLTKQVTNKGLSDSMRLADWMSKTRKDETEWVDQ